MATEFDFTKPFTTGELITHFTLGSPNDPRITKPLSKELLAKGYTMRHYKRKRMWGKWPEFKPFVMPEIP